MLDVKATHQSNWCQGNQEIDHHEESGRNSWSANSTILKWVYTGAVRPVVECASTTCNTASKTKQSKLDREQNMGLRIILVAMGSTSIQEMEKTADLQHLESRREHKAAIQGEKLKRLTSHPFHQKIQHWAAWKEIFQAQVEGPTEGKCQIQGGAKNSHWVSGHHRRTFQKSELKFQAR